MPIETFAYLDSLVATNPPTSDGLVGGDDHIRGIKLSLKQTFPGLTGPVTATQGALNGAAGWFVSGTNKLADTGAFFNTVQAGGPTGLFAQPTYLEVDVAGIAAARFYNSGRVTVAGPLDVTGLISGPGVTPIGACVMWFDDVLPTDGMWAWANGQIIASANIACPVLLARWGSRFGGNGTTTMGVPNLQEVVPVGKSGMGGAASPGLLTSIALGVKNVLGAIFGSDTNSLSVGNLPAHDHDVFLKDLGHKHTYAYTTFGLQAGNAAGYWGLSTNVFNAFNDTSTVSSNITIGSVNGTANDNKTASRGSGTAVNNVQPSKAVNWIIRLG